MTATEALAQFRAIGGRLTTDGERLRWEAPIEPTPGLLEALRQRKADLLALLTPTAMPCLACGGMFRWQDSAGAWHCGRCEPDPSAHRLRGVTLDTLGNRPIALQPPTSDLGQPGSWVRTPAGAAAEVVLYRADGAEVLTRSLKGERLTWYTPEQLSWEIDWPWGNP